MLLRSITVFLACSLPLLAQAQWQWIDKDGRRVFSDQSPPPDIPAKNILRQPGMRGQSAFPTTPEPAAAASAAPAKSAANAPRVTGKDRELEERRKRIEAQEADKKKAGEQEVAEAKAENCRRARESKNRYTSGVRMARINEKGEREIMDDQSRAAEIQRLDAVIARDCAAAQ